MNVGDRVKIKKNVKGDQRAFYAEQTSPDKEYEVEHIDKLGDVYVKGITNYFHQSSLEVCST